MSQDSIDQLSIALFEEYDLPPACTSIIKYLIACPYSYYADLLNKTQLSTKDLNNSLVLLLYDNIITIENGRYKFHKKSCLYRIRHTRMLKYIRDTIGEDAYAVCLLIINEPLLSKNDILSKLPSNTDGTTLAFDQLLKLKYLHSIACTKEEEIKGPEPTIKRRRSTKYEKKKAEKQIVKESELPIVLTLNVQRILFDMRTLHIYEFIKARYSLQSANIISVILSHSDASDALVISI